MGTKHKFELIDSTLANRREFDVSSTSSRFINGVNVSDHPVTVIAVTYNSAAPLRSMLKTVPERCPVIVVDNASEDDSVAVAEQSGASVIVNGQNIGLGRACNKGAEAAESEYLFFLNPDIELEPNTVDELHQATKRYPDASAFAPVIVNQSGKPAMMSKSILVPGIRWSTRELPDTDIEVPAISGAATFVSKRIFEDVGKFDENIFLFYEDDDLSFRLRTQVGPIIVVSSAQLMHLEGQSTPASASIADFRRFHIHRSKTYVTRKHGIAFPVKRKIIVFSLKFLISCLLFRRSLQVRYYYRVLGMLSVEDRDQYGLIDKLISRLARIFKLEPLPRAN